MFPKDKWPFTPNNLNEIIDEETLAVIEAGSRERLGNNMTIIDHGINGDALRRRDPLNHNTWHQEFCRLLRDEKQVQGGNQACETCDIQMAQQLVKRQEEYDKLTCHMGLIDAAQQILLHDRHIATILSGQYAPNTKHKVKRIKDNVAKLGISGSRYENIHPLNKTVASQLTSHVDLIQKMPENFPELLAQEAEHIERILDAEFRRKKSVREQGFLNELRMFDQFGNVNNLSELRLSTQKLLTQVKIFCHCEYVIFYANVQENETVLTAISDVGIPAKISSALPHFNWRKSDLPLQNGDLHTWPITQYEQAASQGIRGENVDHFKEIGYLVPGTIGESYRGVLVFGPFDEPINATNEHDFLSEISRIIGWLVLVKIQQLSLNQERRYREVTEKLLVHQIKTAITPIATQISIADKLLKRSVNLVPKLIENSLNGAHKLSMQLGRSVDETVKAHVLRLESEDMLFENYPLSVLVSNCGETYRTHAEQEQRELELDENIEHLPVVEIDIARLTIALGNLMNNAIKYSFPYTIICIQAIPPTSGNLRLDSIALEFKNIGHEIPLEERKNIFGLGRRGLLMARERHITGTGLGLWETKAVVEAHGGTIDCSCEPSNIYRRREGKGYAVTFRITLPLKQK